MTTDILKLLDPITPWWVDHLNKDIVFTKCTLCLHPVYIFLKPIHPGDHITVENVIIFRTGEHPEYGSPLQCAFCGQNCRAPDISNVWHATVTNTGLKLRDGSLIAWPE